MARQRNPLTGELMLEGITAQTSERTGAVTFRARVTYTDGGGKRRFKGKTFKTYDAAVEWKLETELKIRRGLIGAEPSSLTVADYFEAWYPRHARNLAASTVIERRRIWEYHLQHRIGSRRLIDLRRSDLQRLVDTLCEPAPAGAGLTVGSARNIMLIVSGMLKSAVRDGIIPASPAIGLDYPKPPERGPKTVWTPLQVQRFLVGIRGHHSYPCWVLLASTGCRIGEAVAVRVGDVQLPGREDEPATLWLRHTYRRAGRAISYDPGTKSGPGRLVLLPQLLIGQLAELVEGRDPQEFLFRRPTGEPLSPNSLRSMLVRECARLGLPRISPHGFRHAAASMMIVNQVPFSVVQRILGHRDAQTTLNTYTHLVTTDQAIGARTLDRLLGGIHSDTTTLGRNRAES